MRNKKLKISFLVVFILLYIGTMLVSCWHAIALFSVANVTFMAVILAACFELGQAATLFTILLDKKKKLMPWVLMIMLTTVQVLGNVFSSYKYMMNNSVEDLRYFTESVVQLFVDDISQQTQQVMVAYIIGAILPIVALLLTAMVHNMLVDDIEPKTEDIKNIDDKNENIKSNNTFDEKNIDKEIQSEPKLGKITDVKTIIQKENELSDNIDNANYDDSIVYNDNRLEEKRGTEDDKVNIPDVGNVVSVSDTVGNKENKKHTVSRKQPKRVMLK